MNVTEKLKSGLGRVENIVGKGENAGYQHFLLFPQCFHKGCFLRVIKSHDCVVNGYLHHRCGVSFSLFLWELYDKVFNLYVQSFLQAQDIGWSLSLYKLSWQNAHSNHYHTMRHFDTLKMNCKAVENIVRKGEIACNKQFLLFSQCFLPYMALFFHFRFMLECLLQFVGIWTSLKFCHVVMG